MFCGNCGTDMGNENFCPNCGSKAYNIETPHSIDEFDYSRPIKPQYRELVQQADSGDVEAQLNLSKAYFEGEVTGEPELSRGLDYMKKAAESGDGDVQHMYAGMLETMGLKNESMKWYEMAAHNGNIESQVKLAHNYYIDGYMGVAKEKNYQKSKYWAEKAFNAGDVKEAPVILGVLCLKGNNLTEEDALTAYKLFKLAQSNGNEMASEFISQMEELAPELKKMNTTSTNKTVSEQKNYNGKIYKGIGFGKEWVGVYEDGKIYKGIGFGKEWIGAYEDGKIYKGIGFGKEWIGVYEDGKIYKGIGFGAEWIGVYENGKIYKGIGFGKEWIGEYEGDCGGAAAALLLLF